MKPIQVYLYEVRLQCEFANRAYLELQTAFREMDNFSVFYAAHHFLIHAANVDKLIRPSSKARAIADLPQALGRFAGGVPQARELRNDFEHIDERIAGWLQAHEDQSSYDLTIHPEGTWGTDYSTVRAMSGNLLRFLDAIYDMAAIHKSLEELRSEVAGQLKAFRDRPAA